ncbi:MAG TPA: hypothetical protein VJA21_25905 [Verrucomicrobiae bacterium]
MYIPLRAQLSQRLPWFFGPCFEYLAFLYRGCGFSWDGEDPVYPNSLRRVLFTKGNLEIQVSTGAEMELPTLTVTSLRGKRRVLDLEAIAPGPAPANEPGDYYARYKRVHPLNKEGRAEVDREFEAAAARRIAEFAAFLREHMDELRRAV